MSLLPRSSPRLAGSKAKHSEGLGDKTNKSKKRRAVQDSDSEGEAELGLDDLPDCPVKELFLVMAVKMKKQPEDLIPYMKLVIMDNWYEEEEDLAGLSGPEWDAFGLPGKLRRMMVEHCDMGQSEAGNGTGTRPQVQPRGQSVKLEAPKSVFEGKGGAVEFEEWRESVMRWRARYPDVDVGLLGNLLMDGLGEQVRSSLLKRVKDLDPSFDDVVDVLDKDYGQRTNGKAYWSHRAFREVRRGKRSLRDYLVEFEAKLADARRWGFDGSDENVWMDCLHGAMLTPTQHQNVLAQVEAKVEMKKTVLRAMMKTAEADKVAPSLED